MIQVLALVAPLFGLMLIGYLAGRIAKLPAQGLAWLNFFVIYVALPALFYKLLSQTTFSAAEGFRLVAITTLATFAIFCLSFVIAIVSNILKGKQAKIGEATIQGFAGAYGNVGYMGPPLALAAFGPAAIAPAALIFSFDNALHFTLAPTLMTIDGSQTRRSKTPVWKLALQIIWKIISHPFILATIAGMSAAAFQFSLFAPLENIISMLAAAAAPCALFMMGVSAALHPLKRFPVELSYLVPIKLIVHPLLVYWVLVSFGDFPTVFIQTAVLLAALPSAANVFVIAEQYGQWQQRASSAVVLSTMASVVSLSAVIYYLKNVF